ncbi:hypothetical protein D9758_004738 [Tetrapyrgos nigripes]|uniref:Small ribosomal subunit protein bS18m n=1 Tax=Tetrapyrgos nigripes TaxID=182062 RepID=A0A8H5G5W9_9AGAR|nr:hypothetical protein D9758_004738 [Tetrapyrgos nigripes]
MFSVLRRVARPQSLLRPSVAALSSSARRPAEDDGLTLSDLGTSLQSDEFSASSPSTFQDNNNRSAFRNFEANDFITPNRLSYESVVKRKAAPRKRPAVGPSKKDACKHDPFYLQDVDPLDQALNPSVLSVFVTDMGKILPRSITGLTKKSQRRLGKAIRRAKVMGVIPILRRKNIRSGAADSN